MLQILEGKARYAGLLLAPAEGFGQGFFALLAKRNILTLFVLILSHFWCSVVTSVPFISNHCNIEKNPKYQQKKHPKCPKKSKKLKIQKIQKKIKKSQRTSKKSIKNTQNPNNVENFQKIQKSQKI